MIKIIYYQRVLLVRPLFGQAVAWMTRGVAQLLHCLVALLVPTLFFRRVCQPERAVSQISVVMTHVVDLLLLYREPLLVLMHLDARHAMLRSHLISR